MPLPVRHALRKLGRDIRDARRRLGDLAAPKNDPVGLQLEEEHLPQRIRVARGPKSTKDQ